MKYALCAVKDTAFSFDKKFTYIVPEGCSAGVRVYLPFGRGNSRRIGFVLAVFEGDCHEEIDTDTKEILEIIDPEPIIIQEMFGIIEYLVDTTFSTYYEAVSVCIPKDFPKRKIKREIFTKTKDISEIILSEEQENVYKKITESYKETPKCFLLHGITGSGKTSVFKKLIDFTLNNSKQAMLLVPEIALTPQMLQQFTELFGDKVAVLHSGLTDGQRAVEFDRIRKKESEIVIGTRSAVFAPLENIGIIIIDEEQESSYKSENNPAYSTVNIAKKRCKTHGALLVLASATPSLESYFYANKGIYSLLELNHRFANVPLPEVTVIDMRREPPDFSIFLLSELRKNLTKKEQSILLLNRRGYHTLVMCAKCNQPIYCDACSIPMTYHKKEDILLCHLCGLTKKMPEKCPECGYTTLKKIGLGTQKLEENLQALLPQAKILRMDADVIKSKADYERNFRDFRDKKYDIMLGTQMLGKGLDFPNVTLVGIISVDKALFYGDWNAYERTFSLITQVIGRAGRGDKKGRAVLQTNMPEHYVIDLGAKQDFKGFALNELTLRKTLLLPPFCDICVITFISENYAQAFNAANTIYTQMCDIIGSEALKIPLKIFHPMPDLYHKRKNMEHISITIKCKNNSDFRNFIKKLIKDKNFPKVSIKININ